MIRKYLKWYKETAKDAEENKKYFDELWNEHQEKANREKQERRAKRVSGIKKAFLGMLPR